MSITQATTSIKTKPPVAKRDILLNQLSTILLSNSKFKNLDMMANCNKLVTMGNEERRAYINTQFGTQYLEKCESILHQLAVLENNP